MMNIRTFARMAAIVTAFFSIQACSDLKEDFEAGTDFVLRAELSASKTYNSGLDTHWSEGDAVHVYHRESGSEDYIDDGRFVIEDCGQGLFRGKLASATDPLKKYDWMMVYPYSAGHQVPLASEYQTQEGNSSTAHLCGPLCPLSGDLHSLPGDETPSFHLRNLATVVRVTVINSSNHPMTVNTVRLRSTTLEVRNPGTIAVGESADFHVVTAPFSIGESSPLEVTVDAYKRTFKQQSDFSAGVMRQIRFVYDNPDTEVTNQYAWKSDKYSSFTDIVHFGHKYYIAFREAGGHVAETPADRGAIFIISSEDGREWTKELEIGNEFDLRDPHFIVSDDGTQLYVYCGRAVPGMGDDGYFPAPYCSQVSILHLNEAGKLVLDSTRDVNMGENSRYWLWGVTRHGGVTYGVGYYIISGDNGYPIFVKSTDGINFTRTAYIYVSGNEAHPCFVGDRVYVFFRSVQTQDAFVTYSDSPNYTRWKPASGKPYVYSGMQMHCPVTLYLWDKIFVCMRGNTHGIPIYAFDPTSSDTLPPFEYVWDVFPNNQTDRAYPGMIVHDDCLHVAYYAYDAVKQNIFYQKIPLSKLYTLTENAFK